MYEETFETVLVLLSYPAMPQLAETLAAALRKISTGRLLVVTGAGISHASGIPTFRGSEPEAVWKTSDIELATFGYFLRDPVRQWQWYLQRFEAVHGARPNSAHQALVRLESWLETQGGSFQLVTQNIDTLHESAGSRNLIKVHGTSDRVRCSRPGCSFGSPQGSLEFPTQDFQKFRRQPRLENLPRCAECGSLLRAHVLFFDEFYLEHQDYGFVMAEAAAEQADLIVFVGTSFSVGITDLCLQTGGRRQIPMFSIDPAADRAPWSGLQPLAEAAERLLPATCDHLESLGGGPHDAGP